MSRELDKEFKDSDNPFRVVYACAMWLTGFDVKCLSHIYLDKPLKTHTLMQTICLRNSLLDRNPDLLLGPAGREQRDMDRIGFFIGAYAIWQVFSEGQLCQIISGHQAFTFMFSRSTSLRTGVIH